MADFTLQPSTAFLERAIVTAMVVSDRALRRISLDYKVRFMTASFAAIVAGWCIDYQERYSRAPGPDIRTLFESHRRNGMGEDEARLINQFLDSISREFDSDQFNEELAIDEAVNYFRERSLSLLRDDLEHHLTGGNVNMAQAAVADFIAPSGHVAMGFEPLTDMEGLRSAFEDPNILFGLPGDLGKMLNSLERDNSVAVVGKFKATKSFTSQYLGFHALFSGLNVAWFDFEMGGRRIRRRIAQALCAMPLKKIEGTIWVPTWDCTHNQAGDCSRQGRSCQVGLLTGDKRPGPGFAPPGYAPCDIPHCPDRAMDTWFTQRQAPKELGWRTAWTKSQAVAGSIMGARLKVQSWPKFSAGFNDMKAVLQVWRHLEGFNPDLIICDQPSGMKVSGKGDFRHQVDELWKQLCALPQELHCLGIYPSQAGGKEAQERKRLRDSDVAEHAGILGHVDCSLKIDMDDLDEDAGRAWFSLGVERDDRSPRKYCCVLQCLDLGQPCIDSRFR